MADVPAAEAEEERALTARSLTLSESKTRVEIPFTPELEARTRGALAALRVMADGGRIPLPLVDGPKCVRCSLAGICLPDEINRLSHPELDRAGVGFDMHRGLYHAPTWPTRYLRGRASSAPLKPNAVTPSV